MDGILIIDKPQGVTSHDVVDFVRRRFGVKKAGHAGTLDPMATGILVMLVGNYTKASGRFMSDDKEYEATMTLGATSDTGDADGKIRDSGKAVKFSKEDIAAVFKKFSGEILQRPPMYSAVKHKGRKLYELARKGRTVDVEPRKVHIKKIEITEIAGSEVSFRVTCSKGTYVRQLCADIGDTLGCGAYLSRLRRTRSGRFGIAEALTLGELKELDANKLSGRLIDV